MFSYIFGVLFFYYILDPLRKGLFLDNFPSSQLPYAYFLTAVCAGTIATLVFKLGGRWQAITLMTCINSAIIGTLFYFRWAMGRDLWYLPYVYFVYVKIVSVLSTAQFWLLAGYIYDQRQAKRIYSVLGAGAIVGATAGSAVPAFLSQRLSTESMIFICILVCGGLIALSHIIWRYRRPSETEGRRAAREMPRERFSDLWPMVFGSSHLRLMVTLIFLTLIATQISDWQIDDAAQRAFAGQPQEKLSEFFGRFSLVTNILAMGVQVFLSRALVDTFGVFGAIVFMPAGLFLGSGAVFLYPSLFSTTIARGMDTVSRYSLNRIGVEMLYLPLPSASRKRLKLFVDVFVDRTGRAVAGIVILLMTSSFLPFGQRGTAVVAMGLTFACILICLKLRTTYVNAFRQQLTRREVELSDVTHYVTDPAAVQLLVHTLEGANERQILYSFQLLQSVRNVDFSRQLLPLLHHSSPWVREEAARTLHALPGRYVGEAMELLTDTSEGVRLAAIDYLCSREGRESLASIESLLADERTEIRVAAARWLSLHPGTGFMPSMEFIDGLMALQGPQGSQARATAAALSAYLPPGDAIELQRQLIDDPVPAVAAAAAAAGAASGQMNLVFNVVKMLGVRKFRSGARDALLSYGERIVETLGDALSDKHADAAVRREIPWVLGRIPAKRSVDLLVGSLGTDEPALKFQIVRALNRLHDLQPDLLAGNAVHAAIDERIDVETRAYYAALAIAKVIDASGNGLRSGLLAGALRARLDQRLEVIFRLLGLKHSQKDMYFAFSALKGARRDSRIAAIEFLDNVLDRRLKPVILPLLEEPSSAALVERARTLYGIEMASRNEVLRELFGQPDTWLKACAVHAVGDNCIQELIPECRHLAADDNPLIQETAAWALSRCDNDHY